MSDRTLKRQLQLKVHPSTLVDEVTLIVMQHLYYPEQIIV